METPGGQHQHWALQRELLFFAHVQQQINDASVPAIVAVVAVHAAAD